VTESTSIEAAFTKVAYLTALAPGTAVLGRAEYATEDGCAVLMDLPDNRLSVMPQLAGDTAKPIEAG